MIGEHVRLCEKRIVPIDSLEGWISEVLLPDRFFDQRVHRHCKDHKKTYDDQAHVILHAHDRLVNYRVRGVTT
jgi:hypothetical protein